MPSLPPPEQLDSIYLAIADPTRRAILDTLRAGRRSAGEIAQQFSVSRPAVSRHLRVLHAARLVRREARGRARIYQLNPEPLQHVDVWLERYRLFWQVKLDALKAFVESQTAEEQS